MSSPPAPPSPPPLRRFKDTKRHKKSKRNMETFRVLEKGKVGDTKFYVQFKYRRFRFFPYWEYGQQRVPLAMTAARSMKNADFPTKDEAITWAEEQMKEEKKEVIMREVYYHGYRMPEYRNPPPAPEKPVTA